MLSHANKLLFIHIPKTGGKSIRKVLLEECSGQYNSDLYANQKQLIIHNAGAKFTHLTLLEHIKYCPEISKYFKFAFVRNPWDRAVSEYNWRKNTATTAKDRISFSNFNFFVNALQSGWKYIDDDQRHIATQTSFLCDEKGNLAADRIGRFETLKVDFLKILLDQGVDCNNIQFPHINKSIIRDYNHYRDYYSPHSKAVIAKIYQEDIENFKYSF